MHRFKELFSYKPIIAMVHLGALPGTPLYRGSMEVLLDSARQDLQIMQEAGVDAVMFGNENDRPYELSVNPASVAAMAFLIGRLRDEIRVPFGVNVLWDPMATMALAAATGARFVREVFTGLYGSDMGLWAGRAAEALRYRRLLGCDGVFLLYNVSAEFASPLDNRSLVERARSAVFSSLADAILVSGPMTGEGARLEHLQAVKAALPDVPGVGETGVRHETVANILEVADGAIVGTAFKRDGHTWNEVDRERVQQFMAIVRRVRGS